MADTWFSTRLDIIGDVHGCVFELETLIRKLAKRAEADAAKCLERGEPPSPERRFVFLGDYVDRGPSSAAVLEIVMNLVEYNGAIAVLGNHDFKLLRHLNGETVRMTPQLDQTLTEIFQRPSEFSSKVKRFLSSLPYCIDFVGGELVVAHAGLPEHLQNLDTPAAKRFALYGDVQTSGGDGPPIRRDWAADYKGKASVVYGHTPTNKLEWRNKTICIDTGCAFGGKLTALRWPEKDLVQVEAVRQYYSH
ncbi:metallophosphoesterase [Alisedimentitalea sp. MJ-SS2]|uniref:metallophosphoesterase n=1 Tax=Aliisedimentitalea sp. MJ-SS2 TaxID=3049795 RepID=UPI002907FBF8|nr:metallophosphoesterase [Alisedimentitalea sp. MJ-SS2]MDU8927673.1 metallophosphoesterase [Alisedimentitalea sp. MJ-SS2]